MVIQRNQFSAIAAELEIHQFRFADVERPAFVTPVDFPNRDRSPPGSSGSQQQTFLVDREKVDRLVTRFPAARRTDVPVLLIPLDIVLRSVGT